MRSRNFSSPSSDPVQGPHTTDAGVQTSQILESVKDNKEQVLKELKQRSIEDTPQQKTAACEQCSPLEKLTS